MTADGFSGKTFQTAAFRRSGRALVFRVECAELDADGAAQPVTAEFKVNPLLDTVRLGSALGSLSTYGSLLRDFGQAGKTDDAEAVKAAVMALEAEIPKVRAAVRACLLPASLPEWDRLAESIDLITLGGIVAYIGQELSGMDPTERVSSPDGSPTAGSDSTAGAQPEA